MFDSTCHLTTRVCLQYLPRNAVNWLIYTSVVACVFVGVKLINLGLHRMFDTSECIVEEPSSIDITLECDKRKPSQKPETRYVFLSPR